MTSKFTVLFCEVLLKLRSVILHADVRSVRKLRERALGPGPAVRKFRGSPGIVRRGDVQSLMNPDTALLPRKAGALGIEYRSWNYWRFDDIIDVWKSSSLPRMTRRCFSGLIENFLIVSFRIPTFQEYYSAVTGVSDLFPDSQVSGNKENPKKCSLYIQRCNGRLQFTF